MKKYIFLALFLALPLPAFAQRVAPLKGYVPQSEARSGIVAVVNDSVITSVDLEQRVRLAILSSGLPDKPEVRMHVLPQILRGLIDEQLQLQEAKRLDISVPKEEIDQTIDRISKDNNLPGGILQVLAARGVSPQALISQVRGGLIWGKVVQRELRPRVDVGDDEIDAVIERVRADAGKEEYLISEILLTVDNPKDEDQVRQVADNLVQQIRGGANFAAVARQFSQAAGAAQGGDMGWIQQGQLAPELNKALALAAPGQVSAPIRTSQGFHILGVRDKRLISLGDPSKASLNLVQVFRPVSKDGERAAAMQEASRVKEAIQSCSTIDASLASFPGWRSQKLGDMNLEKAPAWLSAKVRNVAVGGSTESLKTDKGVALLYVCGRTDNTSVDRDAIMRTIGTEKLELQSRRLLRDLRRQAYLDIRIGKSL